MEQSRVHLRQISKPEAADCICEKLKMLLKQSSGRLKWGGTWMLQQQAQQGGAEAVFDELEGRAEGGEAKVCHHLGKLQPSFDALGCGMA